jgi:hypothetical protein
MSPTDDLLGMARHSLDALLTLLDYSSCSDGRFVRFAMVGAERSRELLRGRQETVEQQMGANVFGRPWTQSDQLKNVRPGQGFPIRLSPTVTDAQNRPGLP